jgi:hypothetical protein
MRWFSQPRFINKDVSFGLVFNEVLPNLRAYLFDEVLPNLVFIFLHGLFPLDLSLTRWFSQPGFLRRLAPSIVIIIDQHSQLEAAEQRQQ